MRQFLESVTGLSIYPLMSFVFFFSFFIGFLIWLFSRNKQYIHQMRMLPLDENQPNDNDITKP